MLSVSLCHMRNRANEPLLFVPSARHHTLLQVPGRNGHAARRRAHGQSSDTPRTDPVVGPNAARHAGLSARHVKMRLALPCLGHGWASAFHTSRIRVLSFACRCMDSQVRKQIAHSVNQVCGWSSRRAAMDVDIEGSSQSSEACILIRGHTVEPWLSKIVDRPTQGLQYRPVVPLYPESCEVYTIALL